MATYTIKEYHGTYNRVKRTKDVEYIVVHYTGSGSSASGNALANCKYFAAKNRNASAHYFIDDANIYEYADPEKYYTWHCGGGTGSIKNANSIGIEVCASAYQTDPFTSAEIKRLTYLVQKLMADFGVKAANVVRHYDVTGKKCPYNYITTSKWTALWKTITGQTSTSSSSSSSAPTYTVGKTYTTQVVLNVRKGAGTSYAKLTKSQLTANAQKNCNSAGQLNKGTKVTCKAISKKTNGNVWIQIPSGWIAAYYGGKVYVS